MNDFQRGNAFIYVLIAVALLGALMFTLSRSAQTDAPQAQMDESKAKIAANDILAYSAVATNAITQMEQSGVTTSQIDFMYPSDANFNVAPTLYKVFHPDGGGLNYKTLPVGASDNATSGTPSGYYIGRFNNVVWTPTTARDIIFTAYGITKPVCEALNKKIIGNTTIPVVAAGDFQRYLLDASIFSGANIDFDDTHCLACKEQASMCISYSSASVKYAFYTIIEAE